MGAFAVFSAAAAVSGNIWLLIVLRLGQGCAGGVAVVISRAVVRDRYAGAAAARYFALLMLVNGLAPVLAPIIGAQLLRFTSWRGTFVVLTILGLLLLGAVALLLPESLPQRDRHTGGLATTAGNFRLLLGDRAFVACVASAVPW